MLAIPQTSLAMPTPARSMQRTGSSNSLALTPYNTPIWDAYQKLDQQFVALVTEAREHPVSKREIQPAWIGKLQEEARSQPWQETVGDYVMRAHTDDMQYLRQQYQERVLLLEKKNTGSSPKVADNNYQALNTSFADLEARTSGMNEQSTAVFVGSGPQPNTVLSYAKFANRVTGIDTDRLAIAATQGIAAQSQGKIDFQQMAGENFNYGPYSHVGIAVMVPNKGQVLKQIAKTAKPGCTVIVRSVDGLKNAMYEGLDPNSLAGFEKVATVHGSDKNITHAVILRKRSLNAVG